MERKLDREEKAVSSFFFSVGRALWGAGISLFLEGIQGACFFPLVWIAPRGIDAVPVVLGAVANRERGRWPVVGPRECDSLVPNGKEPKATGPSWQEKNRHRLFPSDIAR